MTDRPWYATKGSGGLGIKGSQAGKGEMVADFSFSQQEDRDLIIKCVNSHESLVAALKDIAAMQRSDCQGLYGAQKIARAALKLVEE